MAQAPRRLGHGRLVDVDGAKVLRPEVVAKVSRRNGGHDRRDAQGPAGVPRATAFMATAATQRLQPGLQLGPAEEDDAVNVLPVDPRPF